MSKQPSDSPSGYYHISIPLDALDEDSVICRPVSAEEAASLTKRLYAVGRNQPCPCGSGIKYKKCCIRKSCQPMC